MRRRSDPPQENHSLPTPTPTRTVDTYAGNALRRVTMRLLSYNIHKGIGGRDRRYRLERIIQVIEAENPDLICLQEVDRHVARSRHDDQPRTLTDVFHATAHLYQLNVRLKHGGYGNLVLS